MRQLIYVPVAHPVPYGQHTGREGRAIKRFNLSLYPYYWFLARHLVSVSHRTPINKVYVESYSGYIGPDGFDRITRKTARMNTPYYLAFVLMKHGAHAVITEHQVFRFLTDDFKNQYAIAHRLERGYSVNKVIKTIPVREVLRFAREYLKDKPPEWYRTLEELCSGEKTFDTVRLRDKFMGRNIDATLENDERGALILGGNHKVEEFLRNTGIEFAIDTKFDMRDLSLGK